MLILFFGVAFSINLCLAHIREVGAESFEELGFKVMERIASAPFTFQDIESWILFSVGVLFACIAALDILYYSDFYPGYTATKRMQRQAESSAEVKLRGRKRRGREFKSALRDRARWSRASKSSSAVRRVKANFNAVSDESSDFQRGVRRVK